MKQTTPVFVVNYKVVRVYEDKKWLPFANSRLKAKNDERKEVVMKSNLKDVPPMPTGKWHPNGTPDFSQFELRTKI